MVHSKRQKSNNPCSHDSIIDAIQKQLDIYVKPDDQLVVGLSGGVDSVVLLDSLVRLSRQNSFKLSAVHVNHGISHNAVAWSQFCCYLCYAYGIPVSVAYLKVKKMPGMSLEAVAREERYYVFSRLQADYLILAQHQDDQSETLLLQLLRGAGVRGLSAMPVIRKQSVDTAPRILRPMLRISRRQIETYAQQQQLDWIHDESNDSITYSRNFLRHQVFPVLRQHYPNYALTLQRASQHMAEASLLLDDLAALDAQECMISGKLHTTSMRQLSRSRAKNLLRYVLLQHQAKLPSADKLEDIVTQLLTAKNDAQVHIPFGDTEIRVYQQQVYILPQRKMPKSDLIVKWQGESSMTLQEWGGSITFAEAKGRGMSQKKLEQCSVMFRMRQGGEHFSPDCKRPRRSLKNLLQEAAVPPWERFVLPLLFCGDKLAWVPGIGIDCEFQALPEEAGLVPEWQFDNNKL